MNGELHDPPVMDEPCPWVCDDADDGVWEAGCGMVWQFTSDGPIENGMRYCPGCGHPVAVPT